MQRILHPPPLIESIGLLERSVGYTRLILREVTPQMLGNPTPCSDWNLADLLRHMTESLEALTEAADLGCVSLVIPDEPPTSVEAVMQVREYACSLLGAWSDLAHDQDVMVGDRPLASSLLACAGALEVAVHGWDVAQATGHGRPLPTMLALDLLPWVPVFVTEADRPERFGPALDVPLGGPSSQLLARLGRCGS